MVLYKIINCPNCNTLQLSSANKIFKCVNCNSSKKIESLKIIFESENPKDSVSILQNLKKEIFSKNSHSDDFFSYK